MNIEEWFEDCDYESGINMLEQHGSVSSSLIAFLKLGENNYTRIRLHEELEKISLPKKAESSLPTKVDHSEIYQTLKTASDNHQSDTELRQLYKERANSHSQMKAHSSSSERKRCAFRVLAITDRIEAKLNPSDDEDNSLPEDPVKLLKIRNNNRAYISKNKDNQKRQGEVNRRIEQNKIIESKISES